MPYVHTAARQALASAAVLWPPADGEGHDTGVAARDLLRTVFPLDWEDQAAALSPAAVRELARRQWAGSGVQQVIDRFIAVRSRAPGTWALARLLSRLDPDGCPPGTAQRRPQEPHDPMTVLASRRQRIAETARALYPDVPIAWK